MHTMLHAFGQMQSPCSQLAALVESRRYQDAAALSTTFAPHDCNEARTALAHAYLLHALGRQEEAAQRAANLSRQFPNNTDIINFQTRLDHLNTQPPFEHLGTPQQWKPEGMGVSGIIAAIANGAPVMLHRLPGRESIFPVKEEPTTRYTQSLDKSWPTTAEQKAIKKSAFTEIGPSTRLPDGRLVISALELRPYQRGDAQPALYLVHNGSVERLPICRKGYSYMHPTFHYEAQELIFASDAPGGQGGMDLWKSALDKDVWQDPVVLGDHVNSAGDELFPHVYSDTLYFASNRADRGMGGVDLYMIGPEDNTPQGLPYPINTVYDDFNLYADSSGVLYFVSDRHGAATGGDMVYSFQWEPQRLYFSVLRGAIQGADHQEGTGLHLISLGGDTLQSTSMDSTGTFSFQNVRGLRSYTIAPDTSMKAQSALELVLYDEAGKVYKKVFAKGSEGFVFELLTPEDYYLERLNLTDQSLLDIFIVGQYLTAQNEPVSRALIILEDSRNKEIARATTDDGGYFRFEQVQPDAQYTLLAENVRTDHVIFVLDGEGRLLQSIHPDSTGNFVYIRIAEGVRQIVLTNERSEQIKIPEGASMALPNLYFSLNSATLELSSEHTLLNMVKLLRKNPDIGLELSGHTDSRGSEEYNLRLSQRRVDAVIEALEKQGLARNRVVGKGYGESKLLNQCGDGVICPEEEHAKNRRIEFQVFELINGEL